MSLQSKRTMTLPSVVALLLLLTWQLQCEEFSIQPPQPQQVQVNCNFIIEILRSIHDVYNADSYVFYITQQVSPQTFDEFFGEFRTEFPLVPIIVINNGNNSKSKFPMVGFLDATAVCLVFSTDVADPVMELAAHSLTRVRELKTIFVLLTLLETAVAWFDIISATFDFIWEMQFHNTVLLTMHDNVYTQDPYPVRRIINLTNHWNVEDFFISYETDFQGYTVDTPVLYDLPRVFVLADNLHNGIRRQPKVSGTSALIFQAFLAAINVTFIDSNKFNVDKRTFSFDYILNKVEDRSIEISPHSNTYIRQSPAGSSYPIGIIDWCIMVPFRNRSPDHLYLKRTFEYSMWLLLLFGCFYITITIWLCTPARSRDCSASFLQAICTILCIVPMSMLQLPTLRIRYIFILLFILGFTTTNMFGSQLTSFLTASPNARQIDTISDIVAANLKILILDYEFKYLKGLPQCTEEFIKQIVVVDKYTLDLHRDILNTNYGYSVTTDRWNFLTKQQRNLRKPLFRLSKVCMGPFYHAFPMQRDSPFYLILKYFIMTVYQSGLLDVWEERTFADALRLKYVRMLQYDEEPIPLSLSFFHAVWIVWFIGLLLAGITFVAEYKWLSIMNVMINHDDFNFVL